MKEIKTFHHQWFKFYGQDWLTDLKIIEMPIEDRLCFITLLCLASASGEQGVIKNCSEESIIRLTHLAEDHTGEGINEVQNARGCLNRFIEKGMITVTKRNENVTDSSYGDITINAFNARQERALTGAERAKRHREKQQTSYTPQRIVTKRNGKVTPSNARVTLEERRGEEIREEESIDTATHKKPEKLIFGEFEKVRLTEEEHAKLVGRMNEHNTALLIAELDTYIASTGKRYSSHYATILAWARRKVIEIKKDKSKVAF